MIVLKYFMVINLLIGLMAVVKGLRYLFFITTNIQRDKVKSGFFWS